MRHEKLTALNVKQQNERETFLRFVERIGTRDQWGSVTSMPEPAPDLQCKHVVYGPIAFELVSLTDPKLAKVQAAGRGAWLDAFFTSDPSRDIVRKKLRKRYESNARHIELLIYTNGRIVTPDDVIIPVLLPWFDAVSHPFKRVWFMGESETCCLWDAVQVNSYARTDWRIPIQSEQSIKGEGVRI